MVIFNYNLKTKEMIKKKEEVHQPIVLDLTGPEGNAFVLMGHAKNFAKQLDLDGDAIVREMMSSDYENLVQVFDRHFGHFVTLLR
jgi:hypothetical protein